MDDVFVLFRSLDFPNGEDGELEVVIDQDVLDNMNRLWKNCMIVRVLGRNMTILALDIKLHELWKPRGGMYVVVLARKYFLVSDLEEEYEVALTRCPWKVFGSYLMSQAWSPDFDPLCDDIITTRVWVRLTNLPVNFYHKAILKGIVAGLGYPVKVDMTTLKLGRARFARVCVMTTQGDDGGKHDRYFVAYEGLTNICSGCGIYGHLVATCPRRPMLTESPTTQVVKGTNVVGVGSQDKETDEGFSVVKNPARWAKSPDGGVRNTDNGNIEIGTNLGNIAVCNGTVYECSLERGE
ncbi:hypothetical protein V2J09_018112 [Rumex salicifolius]